MHTIAIWLASLLPTLAARVLASLGISLLSITGLTQALSFVKGIITANLQGAPSAIVGLLSLAGVGDAIGILFGGITFAITYHILTTGTKFVVK